MFMEDVWKKGEHVISVGGTYDKKDQFTPQFIIFTIVEAGEKDLLVKEYPERRFGKIGKISKESCIRIDLDKNIVLSSRPLRAQIGDLVLSYSESRFEDTQSTTGIVYSITYEMSVPSTCKILSGEELKSVPYNSLIVLQSSFEQLVKK